MTEYAIQAQNVVKKFGDFTAINNITLNVPKGSIYGFWGQMVVVSRLPFVCSPAFSAQAKAVWMCLD